MGSGQRVAVLGAICLLLLCSIVHAHIRLNAPESHSGQLKSELSFLRSAVESAPGKDEPITNDQFGRFSLNPSFGDVFLPLRSAVESVPTLNLEVAGKLRAASSPLRTFIRDSVESLPDYDDENDEDIAISVSENLNLLRQNIKSEKLVDNSKKVFDLPAPDPWTVSDKYAAFVAPSPDDDLSPQPFRIGSPYQQLVKAIDIAQLEHIEDVELIKDQIAAKGESGLDLSAKEELRPYGALSQTRYTTAPGKNFKSTTQVFCYVTNWAFYRKADGKFVPENLSSELCSTIVYSFASLDPDHLTIKEFDPWVDIDNQYYKRVVELGIPVLIAMGGWTDSAGDKYSRLVSDEIKRKVFASNVVGFIKRNGFAGLHLDWNYPKCWQSDCSKGPASDRPNLTKLLREIRSEFDRVDKSLRLGLAISGYKEIIYEAYEFPELSKTVDYMTVMSYDYHGAWERQTGHVSPLYGRPDDKYPQYNTDYTMQSLIKLGARRDKIIMGIPFYGQSFTLERDSSSLVGEGMPSSGPGEAGEFTKQPGMLAYYEICQRIRKHKWVTGRDSQQKSGPYAMLRNQWVGYEDPSSVEAKAQYALKNGFAGIAAWTVDLDDFQNRCCSEAFPLLKAVNRVLGRISSHPPTRVNCERPATPITPMPPIMTTISSDGSSGGSHHEHTTETSWPAWDTSSTTTTTKRPKPTTAQQTSTPWWSKPSTTTEHTTTGWWSRPTTSTSTTTSVPTTTSRRPRPTQTSHGHEQTTIPAPAVVRPVVQPSNCEPGQFYADRSNCNAYYQCITAGELRQQFCPGGLHWNDHSKNCDWPASAQCSEKNSPSYTTARPTYISTTKKRKPSASKRTSTTSTTTLAPTTTRYTTRQPQWPYPTGISTESTTTRPSHKPSRRPTRKPPKRPQKPSARCNEGEYYTHKNCGQYYICVNGALALNSCGGNLHWDAIRKTCDWPENVRCITTKQYLRIVKFRANPNDPCNGEERVAYPGDCTKFLFCLWNRLQAGDCPPGLHFNTATTLCDWPIQAQCNAHGSSSSSESSSESEETNIDLGDNELKPNEAKPVPTKRPKPTHRTTTTTLHPSTSQRPYPTDKPVLEPLDGYYKVVCYFTNWAWYRKGLGRYTPDDINTDLCTHIVYGFAVLDYSNLILRTHDSWADIDNNFYTRVSGLRSKGVKVSLALGGWNDSQGDKYSRLVRDPSARARFVKHAVEFIEKYGFEGLDLDWEYPVCWQTECSKGLPEEKQAFTALVRELSDAFKPKGLLLSTAVSPSKKIIDAGYDVPQLARYFDWIAVMTYDFHGQWDKKTGHVAPLFYHPEDDIEYFNANYSLNYWIEKGAPSRKIVMGMPLYGQSFTLESVRNNGLNAKAPGPGQAGEFTRAAGFLAYYEICDRVKNQGWEVIHDERGRMGPYARKGTQWVSFDDPAMIRKKSQLVRALNLGGGMVWALDLDDFKNRCGDGVHPLLTQIHNVLKDPPSNTEPMPGLSPAEAESVEEEQNSNEAEIPEHIETGLAMENSNENEYEQYPQNQYDNANENIVDPNEDVEEGDFDSEHNSETLSSMGTGSGTGTGSDIGSGTGSSYIDDDFKVVCYFTNWAWYRQGGGKFMPEDIDPELCTHIVYGFAVLNRDNLIIQPHDSWADIDNKFYERVVALRAKGVKVTVAIGGWNDSAGDKYARLVRNPDSRARFVRHVIEFIEKYGFDGLDLDWEYPVCWQVDCKKGTADEKDGFTALVRELSEAFKPKNLLLSAAVSPNQKVIDAGYDVAQLSHYFDWIAVMTYDYHGQWDKKTGHVSPMYDHPEGTDGFNSNFTINYWLQMGAERKKIIMGMPMYGQSFSLAQANDHDLNAKTYGGGEAGEATRARGFLAYYEICAYIQKRGWNVVRDPRGRMGPYAYLRDQWVSFDDAPMIRHKSEYVRAMGLGGAMIWALDLDDFKNKCGCESYPLLKTINRVLRNYPGSHPKCVLEQKEKTSIYMANGQSLTYTPKPDTSIVLSQDIQTIEESYNGSEESDKPKLDCDGQSFVPHPRDCNKYYICQHGELLEQRCPEGLHWNQFFCDWPTSTKCAVRQELTTQRPKTTTTSTTTTITTSTPTKSTKKPIVEPSKKPISRPKPSPSRPLGNNEDYKVVCYFTNWAWYRPGQGKYLPEDIDENLCTHIVYGFAVLNSNTLTIKTHDSWADIDNKFYERVAAYKSKGVRVTVAIGGWNDSLGSKYARLVLDPEARARFIDSVLKFIEKYGFEGLDLDWEYPVCWQVDCSKGSSAEKAAFADLVRELSEAFKPRGLLLSAAVSPSKKVIDAGYDVPKLSRYFDWIAVMCYDYHGHWDKQTGHVAPLYYVDGDTNEFFNSNFTIHYWLEKGAPREKLIMGMPLYGQSFSLANQNGERGLNEKSSGPGQAGTFTRAGGFLAYYEICEKINNGGWTVERDPEGRIGPYAFNGNQWVSYDDVADIRRKSEFVRSLRLGGGMVWALDLDDFRGRCGCGKHPLLRTLNQELRGIPGQRANDCT